MNPDGITSNDSSSTTSAAALGSSQNISVRRPLPEAPSISSLTDPPPQQSIAGTQADPVGPSDLPSPDQTIPKPLDYSVSQPTIKPTEFVDQKPARKWLFPLILLVVLILLTSAFFVSYLIASERIPTTSKVQSIVAQIVYRIPFVPKTPKFLLQSAALAHSKLLTNNFDLSIATTSDDFQSVINTSQIDIQVKGYTDFSDSKPPRFSITANASNLFQGEARKPDNNVYFKINKVPVFLTAALGIDPEKLNEVFADWIVYDTSKLETEARKELDSKPKKEDSPINEATGTILTKMLNENILPYVKTSSDKVDGFPVHKLDFNPTPFQLDRIYKIITEEAQKEKADSIPSTDINSTQPLPSEYIKDFTSSIWIDQKSYHVRKIISSFNLVTDSKESSLNTLPLPVPEVNQVSIALALKLSDFGQDKPIDTPSLSITPEELVSKVMNLSGGYLGSEPNDIRSSPRPVNQAKLTVVNSNLTELSNAITRYYAVNNKYPFTIDDLIMAGELKDSYRQKAAEYGINFRVNNSQTTVLVYADNPVSDPARPYYGAFTGNLIFRSLSHEELTGFN